MYKIEAPLTKLLLVKAALWKKRISSSLGGKCLIITIRDNGDRVVLQNICKQFNVRYTWE